MCIYFIYFKAVLLLLIYQYYISIFYINIINSLHWRLPQDCDFSLKCRRIHVYIWLVILLRVYVVYMCNNNNNNNSNKCCLLAVFWWQACAWWLGRPSHKMRTIPSRSPLPRKPLQLLCRGCTRHTRTSARCARAWSRHTKARRRKTQPHRTTWTCLRRLSHVRELCRVIMLWNCQEPIPPPKVFISSIEINHCFRINANNIMFQFRFPASRMSSSEVSISKHAMSRTSRLDSSCHLPTNTWGCPTVAEGRT